MDRTTTTETSNLRDQRRRNDFVVFAPLFDLYINIVKCASYKNF